MKRVLLALILVNSALGIPHKCEVVDFLSLHCEGLNITSFPQTAYSRFVTAFYLQNNLIQVINEFPSMASLQHLNLSRNAISNVSWKSLVNIPNILELDLSFNRITYVDVSVNRGSLIYFSVSHNKLETFSEENLGIVSGDPEFYRTCVEGNPLHCDCRMAWLQTLILVREKCISGYDSMSCKLYREHPLHLSLRYQNGAGFVCNSPENVQGWPISKVASLAAACEQHVYTTTTLVPT
ncbi:PREDICTED: immunoglobulin superfamily containing leucine-rich repeat protein-like [Branchiostoma belcheri]|uniref:Immunoglobulin superfamily containing leucine-rich repeat protein-like n=1 Tax=Branchiostoma belcheri TaxID=7741 RepID=A0A6P4Y3Z3_BRABE|nr:PREDICTED: immunoglobulin superfamily containing leucine-rich repeat protein-like [Branchiostoma belcheri]